MNRALAQHLLDQLRTGLIQPEELTEPEIVEVIAFNREQPTAAASDIEARFRRAGLLSAQLFKAE
jgi:hypothetical protein